MKNNANKIILKRNERERKNEKEREKKKLFITRIAQKKGNYVHEKVNTETDFLPYLVVIDKEQ